MFNTWFGDINYSTITIITDQEQLPIAEVLVSTLKSETCQIVLFDKKDIETLKVLHDDDLIIVTLSIESYVYRGLNKVFPAFSTPEGVSAKYAFVRVGIGLESFIEGLSTDPNKVVSLIDYYTCLADFSHIKVTSKLGTDISFKVNKFKAFKHFLDDQNRAVYLPASEVCGGIVLGSANGLILVDVTIGQLYSNGKLLEPFGLVKEPVKLLIKESKIVDVVGCERLKKHLKTLEDQASLLVELGIGLSSMTPTGLIGVDESILGTCHFGIGDGRYYGIDNASSIHLDVVIADPTIEVIGA